MLVDAVPHLQQGLIRVSPSSPVPEGPEPPQSRLLVLAWLVIETSLTRVFVVTSESVHGRGAERQADTKGPESCATTSQAGGTEAAAQSSGNRRVAILCLLSCRHSFCGI